MTASRFVVTAKETNVDAIAIGAAVLAIFYVFHRFNRSKTDEKYNIPPCLPVGLIETTRQVASPNGPWFLLEWTRKVGSVFRIRIPSLNSIFVIGDPVVARDILNDPTATKPAEFHSSIDTITTVTSLITDPGTMRWKHARKASAPAFSSDHVRRMNQVCEKRLEEWIQRRLNNVGDANDQTSFDPADEMIFLSLSIICEAAFGYEMSNETASSFRQDLSIASKEFILYQGKNPIRATWLGYLYAYSEIQRAHVASRHLRALCADILQDYRSKVKHQQDDKLKGTVIDCIVNNMQYQNDAERLADMLVFLVAGHDTTAYTLAWSLLELGRHPEVMKQVRNDLQKLTTMEEQRQATSLKNVVKEAYRLHPVAALASIRQVHRNIQVDDALIIPKGSIVFVSNLLIHRNEDWYDKPDEFIPARWIQANCGGHNKNKPNHDNNNNICKTRGAVALMPFGVGPRGCLGQALAEAEVHTVLARLILEYDLEIIDPGKPSFDMTLKPVGAKVKATRLEPFVVHDQ